MKKYGRNYGRNSGKEIITHEEQIIDILSEILGLLREIVNYPYPHNLTNADKEKIEEALRQAEDIHKLRDCFGKGLKLALVPATDFNKLNPKSVITDPALSGSNCQFAITSNGWCVISVRGY